LIVDYRCFVYDDNEDGDGRCIRVYDYSQNVNENDPDDLNGHKGRCEADWWVKRQVPIKSMYRAHYASHGGKYVSLNWEVDFVRSYQRTIIDGYLEEGIPLRIMKTHDEINAEAPLWT